MHSSKRSSIDRQSCADITPCLIGRPAGSKRSHGIAVVDDERSVRVALRHIISSIEGFHCCGEYSSGEAALAGIPGSEAHAVFMDLKMPGMSGLVCMRLLLGLMPRLRVIIATAWADPDILVECYRAGASHHLIKPFSLDSCRAAVRLYCDTNARFILRPSISDMEATRQIESSRCKITPPEGAILDCLVAGMSYKMIQDYLDITGPRLKHLQHRVFRKLGAKNQAQAARTWILLRCQQGIECHGMGDGI
jgi:DNA-binding NarL/FixJ family response regulator